MCVLDWSQRRHCAAQYRPASGYSGRSEAALTVQQTDAELDMALEEERRLAYVAITRAKQHLYVTSPASHHGKPADVSRFLLEAFGMEVPDKRKAREETRAGGSSSYENHSHTSYSRNSNGNSQGKGNRKSIGNASYGGTLENGKGGKVQRTSSYVQHDRQRSAINHNDQREAEMLDDRDEDRLNERRGSGIIRDHKAFSTPGLHPKLMLQPLLRATPGMQITLEQVPARRTHRDGGDLEMQLRYM